MYFETLKVTGISSFRSRTGCKDPVSDEGMLDTRGQCDLKKVKRLVSTRESEIPERRTIRKTDLT